MNQSEFCLYPESYLQYIGYVRGNLSEQFSQSALKNYLGEENFTALVRANLQFSYSFNQKTSIIFQVFADGFMDSMLSTSVKIPQLAVNGDATVQYLAALFGDSAGFQQQEVETGEFLTRLMQFESLGGPGQVQVLIQAVQVCLLLQ